VVAVGVVDQHEVLYRVAVVIVDVGVVVFVEFVHFVRRRRVLDPCINKLVRVFSWIGQELYLT
jgi:hypothetical protein